MISTLRHLLVTVSLLLGAVAWPCSLEPGFEIAGPAPAMETGPTGAPATPVLKITHLRRGFFDSTGSSCFDLGSLTLELVDDHAPGDSYRFAVHGEGLPPGAIPAQRIEPVGFSDGGRGFRFDWKDMDADQSVLSPIATTVVVTRLSPAGVASDPINVLVNHPGGRVPDLGATKRKLNLLVLALGAAVAAILFLKFRNEQAKQRGQLRRR